MVKWERTGRVGKDAQSARRSRPESRKTANPGSPICSSEGGTRAGWVEQIERECLEIPVNETKTSSLVPSPPPPPPPPLLPSQGSSRTHSGGLGEADRLGHTGAARGSGRAHRAARGRARSLCERRGRHGRGTNCGTARLPEIRAKGRRREARREPSGDGRARGERRRRSGCGARRGAGRGGRRDGCGES